MTFDYSNRIRRLQGRMADEGVDVALLSVGADLPYFTGYEALPSERLTVFVIGRTGDPRLFVPKLEAPRAPHDYFDVVAWGELDEPVSMAADGLTPRKVAVGDHMWSTFLMSFQREWAHATWMPASNLTSALRVRKDDEEIELLAEAAHAVDRVMTRIPGEVPFAGRTEAAVARDLAELTVEEGHDHAEFTIVGAGANSASPHHHPGDKVIEHGDLVVCDFGGRISGYHSDSTRTFSVGEPTARQLDVHDVVARAGRAARAAIAPGIPCAAIDQAARAIVTEAGYGDHFIHRTGHGIGLEVHEHPYIVSGNETGVESGMCFSIEPGIYLEGAFGVRIEDIVVSTGEGVDCLNDSPRDLRSVG